MFRNFIFDWSGTVMDDLPPVIDATNQVLAAHGIAPMGREEFRQRFRLPYREFYAELLPHIRLEDLENPFRTAFRASTAPVTLLPHARAQLDWCRTRGMRCFVLTSMDTKAFLGQLEEFDLGDYFEATYSDILDKREHIHQILENHRLRPGDTAYIGDMVHDIETAHHAQLASIAVLTGYTRAEPLAAARPSLIVPDLARLMNLLDAVSLKPRPAVTVGALIDDGQGRVLMTRSHKWGHRWGIQGGKIERGEEAAMALRREIREETGLEITQPRFVMAQDCIDSNEFLRPEHFLLLSYTASRQSGEVVLNEEAQEFRWVFPAEALAMDLNQPTRTLLEKLHGNT